MTEYNQKIIGMDVWQINVPVVSKRSHGIGDIEGGFEVVLLRLRSEAGREGWGEAACWSVFTGSPEASFFALDRYIRPLVIGKTIADRQSIMLAARYAIAHASEAKSALETALLDIEGQIAEKPVWALLGDKSADKIPLSVSIADPDFNKDIGLLERIYDDGVRMVKLKTGFAGHDFDLMRCEAIRKSFPDIALRIDFNQGLQLDEGLARTLDLAVFEPDFIEQPVRAHEYDLMAEICRKCPVLLLADESIFGPEDMQRAEREKIAGGVSIKVMKSGGLTRAREVALMASKAGWQCYGGDMHETGLGHLSGVHLMAATPEIALGCEFYHAKYYVREDILRDIFPIKNGYVEIPDNPGLGIKPDLEKIENLTIRKSAMAR